MLLSRGDHDKMGTEIEAECKANRLISAFMQDNFGSLSGYGIQDFKSRGCASSLEGRCPFA